MSDIPKNPFEIDKPSYALHEIHDMREELLNKDKPTKDELNQLYLLRVNELLYLLDEANAYISWAEDDYKKLQEKMMSLVK